jgi:hypothetical protein
MGIQVINDPYRKGTALSRFGAGVGQGLAEQAPKEVERYRLASGLKQFENESGNLSPLQQLARLASIPGITPQMIQSFGELAEQQGIKNSYAKGRNQGNQNGSSRNDIPDYNSQALENIKFGQLPGQLQKNTQKNQTIPSDISREQEAASNQPAANENPLLEKYIPASPWNAQQDEEAINEAFDRGLATTFQEARAYANNKRELYENAPEKYRQQLDYKKGVDKEVDDLFDSQLKTRLQKEGKEINKDIPGDLQLNIKKVARNAVATKKMTPEQAAEYFSKKALDLAKDKSQALKIANRDIWDRLLPKKKEETIKNLMHIAKNFDDMGSSEDFYNFLKTDALNENGIQEGMGLSPGGAAIIQYPRTDKVKNLIKKTKISSKNPSESTREFAENLFNEMTPKDSFLAIARQMKQQDSNFDEYAFFDFLRENKDLYNTNKRLDREVSNGVSDFFPNWRDIGLFPAFTKSVAND